MNTHQKHAFPHTNTVISLRPNACPVNPFCKRYLLKEVHIYATPQLHRTKKFSQERSLRTRTAAPPECQSDKNKHKKVNFILYLAQLMLSLQLRQTRSAYHYGK